MATQSGASGQSVSELVRKRRLNSRSDEEIEDNIDSRLSFRKGWPVLAPLPLKIVYDGDATKYFPDRARHIPKIKLFLQLQEVEARHIDVVHRIPHTATETNESTATLLISTTSGSGNMFMAVRDIRKYLASEDIHIAIELIDERAHTMKTYAITFTETSVIEEWKVLRDRVVDYLDENEVFWVSVNILHRGLETSKDKCPPTVVISARDAANSSWWDNILPETRRICHPYLRVELLYEGPSDVAKSTGSTVSMEHFNTRIPMGGSCGPASTEASATLGGTVSLRRNGQDVGAFALSNHHVMMSESLENSLDANTAISPSHSLTSTKALLMKSPSDRDARLKLENVTQRVARLMEVIDGTSTDIGLQAKVDMGQESKRRHLESHLSSIREDEKDMQTINQFDRTVGHLYASSGHRFTTSTNGELALDWSLTAIRPSRTLKNSVEYQYSQGYVGRQTTLDIWHNLHPGNRRVAKLGSSTGWTDGVVSQIDAVLSGTANPYQINVRARVVASSEQHKCFSLPEDSGSVVFDADDVNTEGCWIGLLFAANTAMGTGYFTPIAAVFDDIASVTGCEVVKPELCVNVI